MKKTLFSELHKAHTGNSSDKWTHYLDTYDRLLAGFQNKPINLLEVGVFNGGSLEIWNQYFKKAKHIVGCDIDSKCQDIQFVGNNIDLVIGDIKQIDTLARINAISERFDVIIDDGSHRSSDIIAAFVRLFSMLNDGGVYIIEDLHCSYWHDWGGSLDKHDSAMNFLKILADMPNYEHWDVATPRVTLLQHIADAAGIQESDLAAIHSVEFSNSLCVVRKQAPENNHLGLRVICGETFVLNDTKQFTGTVIPQPAKQARAIATELVAQMQQQLAVKDQTIYQQQANIQQLVQYIHQLQAQLQLEKSE